MEQDGHRKKAARIERSLTKLTDGADYEMINEGCYAASIHYIALICDRRTKRHHDTHKGLTGFQDENDLSDLSSSFRELESLRTSKYHGGQGNGKSAREARRILAGIKAKLH